MLLELSDVLLLFWFGSLLRLEALELIFDLIFAYLFRVDFTASIDKFEELRVFEGERRLVDVSGFFGGELFDLFVLGAAAVFGLAKFLNLGPPDFDDDNPLFGLLEALGNVNLCFSDIPDVRVSFSMALF